MDALLNSAWFWAIIRIVIVLGFVLGLTPIIIYWERRLLSWMQDRVGPNRVGPKGLLQTVADGIKLFFKEEVRPDNIDLLIYWTAPAIALFPAFVASATIPWGPPIPILDGKPFSYLTPIANVNIGVLWLLGVTSLSVYGIVLAGWASNNKYSLLGGLRSGAQLISYELSMGLSLGAMILVAGSLQLPDIVNKQSEAWLGAIPFVRNWFFFTPYGLIAGVIFLVCMVAETNRAPFDLPEAESELIAGFHTEYSSMKFAVFYMGEYASMLTLSAIMVTMFLGGYTFPINVTWIGSQVGGPIGGVIALLDSVYLAPVHFLGKLFLVFSLYIWLRATLPRLRYDQLMGLGWRGLLPMTLMLIGLIATWLAFGVGVAAVPTAALLIIYCAVARGLMRKQHSARRVVTLNKEAVPYG